VEGRGRNRIGRFCRGVVRPRRVVVPLIRTSVAVGVVLAADENALLVKLRPIVLAVAFRGNLDSLENTRGVVERLRVHHAVVFAREPDFFEVAVGTIEVPPLDFAVFVQVQLHADAACTVHVADGVVLPDLVQVEHEYGQTAGRLVVISGGLNARSVTVYHGRTDLQYG